MPLQIRTTEAGVDFVDDDRFVRVDTRAHDLRLENDAGETRHFGALRASLLSTMDFLAETFDVAVEGRKVAPGLDALARALSRAAGLRGLVDASLEAAVAEVYPTPLLYAAPFLDARYVWQDAFRFRPCRIAIAHVEDDAIDDDRPETAGVLVERLQRWRDLYAHGGKANRALNAALERFGETLPADALWGLRRVPLARPREDARALEVLGYMGAAGHRVGDREKLERLVTLVERANDAEMEALLARTLADGIPRRSLQAIALFLLLGDPESRTLLQLVRSAAARTAEERRGQGQFPPPPVPLPAEEGLRWIPDVKTLRDEGDRMHHCVAWLAPWCLTSEAYVFHAEHDGQHATIHLGPRGVVVEARGSFNHPSVAARWGAHALEVWGARLWLAPEDRERLAILPGAALPPDVSPFRTLGAFHGLRPRRASDPPILGRELRKAACSS